jgi:NAD(P)-dependent dehydrogenase (short-subunit alcohol dehydrogenase family)
MSGLRLDGRVAAVTGAGRGIGRAYALYLAELGAKVVVNDLGGSTRGQGAGDNAPADEVVNQIQANGGEAVANYADVSTEDGGRSVIDTATQEFGTIDILVNNAGNMVWGSLPEAGIDVIEAHWAVHVRGAYNTIHAAWPIFQAKNYGRVVLSTSVGLFGLKDNVGYATAKASMIGLANSITVSRGRADINVNCIAPNAVTRLAARTEHEAQQMEASDTTNAMDPALVAPMVAYLVHDSCHVSGEVFVAGAGRFARLFVGVTPGYVHPSSQTQAKAPTIDDIAANINAITDEAGYYVPTSLLDWTGPFLAHLKR